MTIQDPKGIDRSILTDFSRFYILLLLHEGQEHGYRIMQTLEERLGRRVSPSLVYPFLKILEDSGYVRSRAEHSGQKRKNIYSLTSAGRALCNDLFRQFTTIVSSAIEPSMHACAHCGCSVFKDGFLDRIKGKNVMFCCKYCAAAYEKENRGNSRGG